MELSMLRFKYGSSSVLFLSELQIGPYIIDWNNDSIVVSVVDSAVCFNSPCQIPNFVQSYGHSSALMTIDLHFVDTSNSEMKDDIVDKVLTRKSSCPLLTGVSTGL